MHCVLEDHTGAAKEAMIQAEQMIQQTKEAYEARKLAYDARSVLQANVRVSAIKTCEIRAKYANLESEKNQLQLDLEVTTNDLNVLKKALGDKDKVLAEANDKYAAAEEKLLVVSMVEEENAILKKERSKWAKKLEQMAKRGNAMEKYLGDFVNKMLGTLTCMLISPSESLQNLPNEL
ncbi:hypothetical protein D1007_04003 [Hordeum vulgare]|nr:hypothetical protein D1007_04003 [Hordeum vulgare]